MYLWLYNFKSLYFCNYNLTTNMGVMSLNPDKIHCTCRSVDTIMDPTLTVNLGNNGTLPVLIQWVMALIIRWQSDLHITKGSTLPACDQLIRRTRKEGRGGDLTYGKQCIPPWYFDNPPFFPGLHRLTLILTYWQPSLLLWSSSLDLDINLLTALPSSLVFIAWPWY